ncbi:MAG: 3-deoxy-8-phosphooctulonate synthase [Candidatus Eisenbacteria bacterium]|nr:3-deoxy-8-phosphooctulonate synthase [Candidatus Eisenbacteria bacterium]
MGDRGYRFLGRTHPAEHLFVIAGPCVIESEQMSLDVAGKLREICSRLGIGYVFKSSYRKDNRSSVESFVGPDAEKGLAILSGVRREIKVPVLTDVHCRDEVAPAAAAVDVLQIPAFLCRQTRLLQEAARACGVVNVKKGQFMAPDDMGRVLEKLEAARPGGEFWLTERGTTFGYRDLVVDMRGFAIMGDLASTVVFDVTHSLQHPGAGGDRRFARTLARAAIAAGADGLFLETHPEPESALSDPTTQLPLSSVASFLEEMLEWKRLCGRRARMGEA